VAAEAPTCYCGSPMHLRDGKWGKFWGCSDWPQCDGLVACHKGTSTPRGKATNKATRDARIRAHAAFDALWEPMGRDWRGRAYRWLAEQVGHDAGELHIGYSGLEMCQQIIEVCEGAGPEDIVEWDLERSG